MGSYEGPRNIFPEEFDELLDLEEKAYGDTKQNLVNYDRLWFVKGNIAQRDYFVIKEDGKLVSCVALVSTEEILDTSKIKIGYLGGVATHPDYQSKGYMGKLLEYTIGKMKERGISLSILEGNTQRYRHFGWETSGRKIIFHLNKRSLGALKIGEGFVRRSYDKKKDLDRIIEIYREYPLRIERSRRYFEEMLKRTQMQIWIGTEEDLFAYAVLYENKVIEFGGDPFVIIKLFYSLLNHYLFSYSDLTVFTPYRDSEILRILYDSSYIWEVIPLCMIKIVDLKKVLLCSIEQMKKKSMPHKIEKGGSLTLEMKDSDQKATISFEDTIKVEDSESQNVLSLSDIEMVRLLFGLSPEEFGAVKEQRKLLVGLFPLDFYLWGLDCSIPYIQWK